MWGTEGVQAGKKNLHSLADELLFLVTLRLEGGKGVQELHQPGYSRVELFFPVDIPGHVPDGGMDFSLEVPKAGFLEVLHG